MPKWKRGVLCLCLAYAIAFPVIVKTTGMNKPVHVAEAARTTTTRRPITHPPILNEDGIVDYGHGDDYLNELVTTYEDAFTGACADVWANSDGDALYYEGTEYDEGDCENKADPTVVEDGFRDGTIATFDDAESAGRSDGVAAAFSDTDTLCFGDQCWTADDF